MSGSALLFTWPYNGETVLLAPCPQSRAGSQLSERKSKIKLTDPVRELLFQQGYDPQFGARPLKRAIQRLIQDPLAMKLLDGEIAAGDSLTIDADLNKGAMIFERAKAKVARK